MGAPITFERGLAAMFAALVAAGAMLAAAAPAPAAKAKPKPIAGSQFFGVIPTEVPSSEELSRMAGGGIGSVRLVFSQASIEPSPGNRDWVLHDQIVGDAARAGLEILPWVLGTPAWMNPKPALMPIQNATQEAQWSAFLREAADRYGTGGSFWATHPDIPYRPLRNWQIWNEPNINEYVGGERASPARYARLVAVSANALRSADHSAKIVLAGLFRRPRSGYGVKMITFLRKLYRVPGIERYFDAVAIHPYSSSPEDVVRTTEQARRVIVRAKDAKTPLWITELGWTTGGNGWSASPYRSTPAMQAERLERVYRLLKRQRGPLGLRRVIWHTWRDYDGGSRFWTQFMGLFTHGGQPKPAWRALLRVTGGRGSGPLRQVGYQPIPPGPVSGGGAATTTAPQIEPEPIPPTPIPPPCLLPGLLC